MEAVECYAGRCIGGAFVSPYLGAMLSKLALLAMLSN